MDEKIITESEVVGHPPELTVNVAICQPSPLMVAFVLKLSGVEKVRPELLDQVPDPITGKFADKAILENEQA